MSTKLKDNKLKFWLAFNQLNCLGPIRWKMLLKIFNDLEMAWNTNLNYLIKKGVPIKIAENLIQQKNKINPDLELEKFKKSQSKVVTILDKSYPKILKEIYAPPPLLYYLGNLDNTNFSLAVVGSRKITEYGKQVTNKIVGKLSSAGMTIVSGLALGIDTLAHQTALEFKSKTIAVLGSGINKIYPASNRWLAENIIKSNGLIISEFPLNMSPFKYNFPRRNRIISGLSLGTLIIEAKEKSGALITAKYALEQNREVFAVPGNIYKENCKGPNNLIKLGAKAITDANDILDALNLDQIKEKIAVQKIIPENETEKIILKIIKEEALHVDKITKCARLNISIINSALAIMEMKGMVKNLGDQKYIKAR